MYGNIGGIAGYAVYMNIANDDWSGVSVQGDKKTANTGNIVGYWSHSENPLVGMTNTTPITSAGNFAGGFIGSADNLTFQNCTNSAAIQSNNNTTHHIGGLTGKASACTFTECKNTEPISGLSYIGGIVGEAVLNTAIQECKNLANISASASFAGGILGVANTAQITDCVNTAELIPASDAAGGIVGGANGSESTPSVISNCDSIGSVRANVSMAGGIAGQIYNFTTVEHCIVCVPTGLIGSNVDKAGGIVGAVSLLQGTSAADGTATISNNMVGAFAIYVCTLPGGEDYGYRIIGFIPVNSESDNEKVILENNFALPGTLLYVNNKSVHGWTYEDGAQTAAILETFGKSYDFTQVIADTDTDYGANSMNGANITCSGVLTNCLACLSPEAQINQTIIKHHLIDTLNDLAADDNIQHENVLGTLNDYLVSNAKKFKPMEQIMKIISTEACEQAPLVTNPNMLVGYATIMKNITTAFKGFVSDSFESANFVIGLIESCETCLAEPDLSDGPPKTPDIDTPEQPDQSAPEEIDIPLIDSSITIFISDMVGNNYDGQEFELVSMSPLPEFTLEAEVASGELTFTDGSLAAGTYELRTPSPDSEIIAIINVV
jgi:hypothetical protein